MGLTNIFNTAQVETKGCYCTNSLTSDLGGQTVYCRNNSNFECGDSLGSATVYHPEECEHHSLIFNIFNPYRTDKNRQTIIRAVCKSGEPK